MQYSSFMVGYIIIGTLLVFGGWGLYRVGIRAVGFLIGALIGVALSYAIMLLLIHQHPSLEPYALWIILLTALLLGLLNARIFLKFYYLVIFIAGAIYGAMLKTQWLDQWEPAMEYMERLGVLGQSPWGEIIAALILGLLVLLLHKYVIILLTSILGSALIAISTEFYWTFPLLMILGIISQLGLLRVFRLTPPSRRKE